MLYVEESNRMPKRPTREKPSERKGSLDLGDQPPPKKRRQRKKSEEVILMLEPESDSETDNNDDAYQLFVKDLLDNLEKEETQKYDKKEKQEKKKGIEPSMELTRREAIYFKSLNVGQKLELNLHMDSLKSYTDVSEVPLKFRILKLPLSDYIKSSVLKKVEALENDTGEHHKLKNWVDSFLKIPFGKTIPLPVKLEDGKEKCSEFLQSSRQILDKAVFGMTNTKTQIMQVLSQWMANPDSVGNVIALHGPAGVGKTSIARNGIARALCRPFEFFSLGGASDIATYTGHSYTYEGSMWGRIADALMHSKCMNPVLYFDELDKISGTPHGEEIASMLIHLTDRSQNKQFHDRYFAGIDFDVSQCLFVFSFNDLALVNPILKDRMQIIHCSGYSSKEKQSILEDYIWPDLLERLKFSSEDILLNVESSKFLIAEYSSKEQGVRTLIRTAETIITRLNMLRIANEETMKEYKFFINVEFPLQLNPQIIKKLLFDIETKPYEPWRTMFN